MIPLVVTITSVFYDILHFFYPFLSLALSFFDFPLSHENVEDVSQESANDFYCSSEFPS